MRQIKREREKEHKYQRFGVFFPEESPQKAAFHWPIVDVWNQYGGHQR